MAAGTQQDAAAAASPEKLPPHVPALVNYYEQIAAAPPAAAAAEGGAAAAAATPEGAPASAEPQPAVDGQQPAAIAAAAEEPSTPRAQMIPPPSAHTTPGTPPAPAHECLDLEVAADEAVTWAQLGHLRMWAGEATRMQLSVPPVVGPDRVADTIRLAYNFPRMQQLSVRAEGCTWRMGQAVVGAAAELLGLRSLTLTGGTLDTRALRLHVLTGLRDLTELRVVPARGGGLGDEAVSEGLALLQGLRALEFRGSLGKFSDEGLTTLTSLTALTELRMVPVGLQVTQAGLYTLCSHLPALERLAAGVAEMGQADILRCCPDSVRELSLVVGAREGGRPGISHVASSFAGAGSQFEALAPLPGHADVPALLATCTLCLATQLVSLRMSTVKAEDPTFLMALGSLTCLTELALGVAPARRTTRPFALNLASLQHLRALRVLDVAVVGQRVALPLTPRLLEVLAAAWPQLTSLSLSAILDVPTTSTTTSGGGATAAKGGAGAAVTEGREAEAVEAAWKGHLATWGTQLGSALALLGRFQALRKLSLFTRLPDEREEEAAAAAAEEGRSGGAKGGPGAEPVPLFLCDGVPAADEEEVEEWEGVAGEATYLTYPGAAAEAAQGAGRGVRLVEVVLSQLPQGLEELSLERAKVVAHPSTTPSSGAGEAQGASPPVSLVRGQEASLAGWADGCEAPGAAMGTGASTSRAGSAGGSGSAGGAPAGEAQPQQQQAPSRLLPELRTLELSGCRTSDETLAALFSSAIQLTCVELNEVRGVSGAAVSHLTGLPRLAHLEVLDSRPQARWAHAQPAYAAYAASAAAANGGDAAEAHVEEEGEEAQEAENTEAEPAPSRGWLSAVWDFLAPAPASSAEEEEGGSGAGGSGKAGARKPRRRGPPRAPPAHITNTDLHHLGLIHSLRHLQWAVGGLEEGAGKAEASAVLRELKDLHFCHIGVARDEEGQGEGEEGEGAQGERAEEGEHGEVRPRGSEAGAGRGMRHSSSVGGAAGASGLAAAGRTSSAGAALAGVGAVSGRRSSSGGGVHLHPRSGSSTSADSDSGLSLAAAEGAPPPRWLSKHAGRQCKLSGSLPVSLSDVWSNSVHYHYL